MPTYADELRKLADLLDNDFLNNEGVVFKELLKICLIMSADFLKPHGQLKKAE